MLIKEKILFKDTDVTLKINLNSDNSLGGMDDSINTLIAEETDLSINTIIDGDKFRYSSPSPHTFNFKFATNFITSNGLIAAGFSSNEITNNNEMVLRSFYVIQIYDTKNEEKQQLLHIGYYNGFNYIAKYGANTAYILTVDDEFTNLYLLNKYMDSLTTTTPSVYVKFLFYNAKLGKLHPFYNETNEALTTDDKYYFEFVLDKINKTYALSTGNVFDIKEDINSDYVTKINTTINSFTIEKPTYPTGELFNKDGTYTDV